MIPVEAVEAAAKAVREAAVSALSSPSVDGVYDGMPYWEHIAQTALEAAAPILLSHERELTRLAHLDAMVNRETKRDELAAEYRRGYRDGLIDRKQVTAEPREWEPGDPLE